MSTTRPTPTEFDHIVVGAGSAGAALAARLSEDPSVSVALLEAGPDDRGLPEVLQLDRWMELLESGYDWDYPVEPQTHGNSHMRHARARVLGGCSSHNSCIAFIAPRADLAEWESRGATGWGSDETYAMFDRVRDAVNLMQVPAEDPCGVAVLEGAAELGIPTAPFNTGSPVEKQANFFQVNRLPDGTRASSSVSYLHPIADRENLHVITGAWVTKLIIENGRCVGVRVVDNAFGRPRELRAGREVIVSAGAIDSPKLLMLSGIGPAGHLREAGVDVVVDSPGVGEHLQDHPEGVISWEASQPMVTESWQWWEIGIFTMLEAGLDRADLMMHYGNVPFDMHTVRQGYDSVPNAFCLTPNVTHARSEGTVRLRSRDFRDKPRVDPRYFTDPDGHDLRTMVAGLRLAREIAATAPMRAWAGRELFPTAEARTDEQLAAYVQRTHNTVYHPVGTVRMGTDDDSPLTPDLRVKGVDGLRVADASVFPSHTTVNPNLTVMMVGEKAAELIRTA